MSKLKTTYFKTFLFVICLTNNKMNRKLTKGETISANRMSDEGLAAGIYKELWLNNNNTKNSIQALSRHVFKENIHTRSCSVSLAIRDMQIRTSVKCHPQPRGWLKPKKQTVTTFSEEVEKLKLHILVGKWCSCLGKQRGGFSRDETITVWSSNSTPRYLPKRNENVSAQKLVTNVHSCISHNSRKAEMTQRSMQGWMEKHNVEYTYIGL